MPDSLQTAVDHHRAGRLQDAEAAYRSLLRTSPNHADALHLLGVVAHQGRRHDEALDLIGRALALNPSAAPYQNNFGEALRGLGRLEEAAAAYARAIELRPDYADAYDNLGIALAALGRAADAEPLHRQALNLQPGHANARWNLGLCRLLLGDFDAGWEGYEGRWQSTNFPSAKRSFSQPMWDGSDPAGRSILVYCEQGAGDAIHFARYIPLLTERGFGRVVLECPPALHRLFESLTSPVVEVVRGGGGSATDCDLHVPLLSLPRRFGTTEATIPARVPYLSVDSQLADRWERRLGTSRDGLLVGVVWAGNPRHGNDVNRSLPLEALAPLAGIEGAKLISLQKGPAGERAGRAGRLSDERAGLLAWNVGPELGDFADTAAVMSRLDLILSADTAAAHLAGALGRPVWTMIPFAPDWRWMLGRDDSPWYPTMRLFRQSRRGDWAGVVSRVAHQLADAALPRRRRSA